MNWDRASETRIIFQILNIDFSPNSHISHHLDIISSCPLTPLSNRDLFGHEAMVLSCLNFSLFQGKGRGVVMWFEVLCVLVPILTAGVTAALKIPKWQQAVFVVATFSVCSLAYGEREGLLEERDALRVEVSKPKPQPVIRPINLSFSLFIGLVHQEVYEVTLIESVDEELEPETMAPTEPPLKSYVEIHRYPALDCNPCPLHYIQSFVWSVENECVAASYVSVEHICLIR